MKPPVPLTMLYVPLLVGVESKSNCIRVPYLAGPLIQFLQATRRIKHFISNRLRVDANYSQTHMPQERKQQVEETYSREHQSIDLLEEGDATASPRQYPPS
jgi:hypothetical protein